jgi:hypothetical protein
MVESHAKIARLAQIIEGGRSPVEGVELWDLLMDGALPKHAPGFEWHLRDWRSCDRLVAAWIFPELTSVAGFEHAACLCQKWTLGVWDKADIEEWAVVCDFFLALDNFRFMDDPCDHFYFMTPFGAELTALNVALAGIHWRELRVLPEFQHSAWRAAQMAARLHHDETRWEVRWLPRAQSGFERMLAYMIRDEVIDYHRRPINIPYGEVEGREEYEPDGGWIECTSTDTQEMTANVVASISVPCKPRGVTWM